MLRARPGARQREGGAEAEQPAGQAGQRVAEGREHRPGDEDGAAAHTLGEPPARHLEDRHGPGVEAPQGGERAGAQPELGLPHRQQDVDHVREAVVQSVREGGSAQGASGLGQGQARCGKRGVAGGGGQGRCLQGWCVRYPALRVIKPRYAAKQKRDAGYGWSSRAAGHEVGSRRSGTNRPGSRTESVARTVISAPG